MPRLFLNPKRRIFKPLDKSGIILLITHNPHLGSRHIPKSADRHDIQIIEQHPLRCALRGCCRYISFRYTLIMEYTQILVLTYTERIICMPIDYGQLILLTAKYLVTLEIIIKRTITLSTANAIRKEYGNQTPIIL